MVHWASHTGVKPFKCGQCGQRSFALSEGLTKHLKICGQSNTVQCNKCGKGYSNQSRLAAHIKDVHDTEHKWICPFCDVTYESEGGYYGHLRMKHGVGQNGKKLSTALIEKISKEDKDDQQASVQNENDESTEVKSTNAENSGSEKSEENNAHEDTSGNAIDNAQVSKENVPSSASTDMTHKCPFPSCCNLELPNEAEYFNHLWSIHKLGHNK